MDREAIQKRFGIIGESSVIRNVIDRMRQVSKTDITVLIQGESGAGKELIAQGVHALSQRRHNPLIVVNCGAIPEGLIESELFGAEKGAYTGAVERRSGYFEQADGSTVFLDEIGEMPQSAQVRLLRVLESGEFSRVGSAQTHHTDVRVIAATNKDLAREVETGRFREDLYYRLSTVEIKIPPLRERSEDILPIFDTFVHRVTQEYNATPKRLTDEARELLRRYRWPGNVRELRNVAEQVVVLTRGETVTAEDVKPFLRGVTARTGALVKVPQERDVEGGETQERELLYRALWELRMEMRELKEQVQGLAEKFDMAVPREALQRSGASGSGDFVIVRPASSDREEYASLIEDVPYEIENDEPVPQHEEVVAREPTSEPVPQQDDEIPTLEDAERKLIAEALKRFDGNRRQTAKALGISERTLYRKLKEIDEDL